MQLTYDSFKLYPFKITQCYDDVAITSLILRSRFGDRNLFNVFNNPIFKTRSDF